MELIDFLKIFSIINDRLKSLFPFNSGDFKISMGSSEYIRSPRSYEAK